MRLPIVTLSIAFVTAVLYVIGGAIPEQLIWVQDDASQIWQWVSAHFSHISGDHLVWNIAALIILGGIIEQTSRKVLGLAMVSGIIAVNIYLATFYTLNAYAGLSGALNALLLVALYFLYQQAEYKTAALITLVIAVSKILIEYSFKLSLFSDLPWPSVPQAHLAGLIGGLSLVAFLELRKRRLLNSDLVAFADISQAVKVPTLKAKRNSRKHKLGTRRMNAI